ncbi:MAG: GNAT family N-acetyltransferase [Pseudomonadota bacterium]
MTIAIHSANEKDLQTLYGIYDANGQSDDGYFEKCLELQEKGEREILIASLNDKPVGFCILNWKPRYALYQKLGIPEIQDLNVIPYARRQGVAKALIAYCETRTCYQGQNVDQQLGVSVPLGPSFGAAQRLYWSQGYQPDGMGPTQDRQPVVEGQAYLLDQDLCLMLVKAL